MPGISRCTVLAYRSYGSYARRDGATRVTRWADAAAHVATRAFCAGDRWTFAGTPSATLLRLRGIADASAHFRLVARINDCCSLLLFHRTPRTPALPYLRGLPLPAASAVVV